MTELERDILKYLATRSGEVSFYHLVRMFGFDSSRDLPAICEKLKSRGLIEEKPCAGAMPLLVVTPAGNDIAKPIEGNSCP